MKKLDIYIVGVGGQGVLTIGDIIAMAMEEKNYLTSFYPTKGMAQRGGFVKAQLRIGEGLGPNIPLKGADVIISMERSESLKAAPYINDKTKFIIYGHTWFPTGVMLGKDPYPAKDAVVGALTEAGAQVVYLDEEDLPLYEGAPMAENIYLLGGVVATGALDEFVSVEDIAEAITKKWPKGAERNLASFYAGVEAAKKLWA